GTPWQFFTDHTDAELAKAVSEGRRRELAAHGWTAEEAPDPQDPATRGRPCPDWPAPERAAHARVLAWYRRLIQLPPEQPDLTDAELAKAVSEGRRREFAAHGWTAEEVPDPQDPATRDRSCLDWSEPEREPHARVLAGYRRLIEVRHEQPDLTDPDLADTKVAHDEELRWLAFRRGDVLVAVNLADGPAAIALGAPHARVLAAWEPVDSPGP